MSGHFPSVECHRFQNACFINALSPAPGKYHILFFPAGNAGVVWHDGNWHDIPPNRLFCIKTGEEFSVRCGEGAVECFAIVFESGDLGRIAMNDSLIVQQNAGFIAMNVELAMACLVKDRERTFRALRDILDEIDQMTTMNRITFAIRHVGPTVNIPDHFHSNEYQIDYFASGEGAIRIDRCWIKCGPGSFSFIPPLVPHEILYEQSQDMDNYGVKFQFSADPRIKSPPGSPFVVDVAEEKQGEALGLLKKIVGEYTMDLPISSENLNQLIALVYDLQEREGAGGKKNSLASRVKRIVRAGYAGPLRVSAIAAQVGVSPEHLSRNFHKTTGKTLAEYITVCRLRSALVMLQNTALPIKQIAAECGFSSVNYFSNRFKKYYARTPGEMRRRELVEAAVAP
jgi:AraC-like DNA-binding protein/mannose-6-phosphate isomerase-like protein (cupin superfamily)